MAVLTLLPVSGNFQGKHYTPPGICDVEVAVTAPLLLKPEDLGRPPLSTLPNLPAIVATASGFELLESCLLALAPTALTGRNPPVDFFALTAEVFREGAALRGRDDLTSAEGES